MVGFTAEGEVPSAVRPDRRRDGHRPSQVLQRPTLFDVQLDIHADTVGERVVGAEVFRVAACVAAAHRRAWFRRCPATASARSTVSAPVLSCDPTQATPNRAPSSSANATTATGMTGAIPRARTKIDRMERRHHAEGPVERTAVGYRVEVRSGDECTLGVSAPTRGHPPGPRVAVAVLFDCHAATLRFGGEPFAQREIGGVPGESAIAAGGRFATDVEDRLPQGVEVGIEVHY